MSEWTGQAKRDEHESWINGHLSDGILLQRIRSILIADPRRVEQQKRLLKRVLGE